MKSWIHVKSFSYFPQIHYLSLVELHSKMRTSLKATKYTIEAIGETEVLILPFKQLQKRMEGMLNFFRMMQASYMEIIQTLVFRVEILIDKVPEERYEELLDRSPQFFQQAYNKHIANYLGITPVSLSRIIRRKLNRKN